MMGDDEVARFSDAIGFGNGVTEPPASLDEMVDPIREAFTAQLDHFECPVVCEHCGESLASVRCPDCDGSGCEIDASLGHQECARCAGKGKVHDGCSLMSYADLRDEASRLASSLSELLWTLTGGRMSKTTYDVPTMVREIESYFEDTAADG